MKEMFERWGEEWNKIISKKKNISHVLIAINNYDGVRSMMYYYTEFGFYLNRKRK